MKTSLTMPLGIALALVWLHPASTLYAQGPQYYVVDLGTLGGTQSSGTAINNSGQVTGYSTTTADTTTHAFLYSGGSMHDLGTLVVGSPSLGYGINDSGQVTGSIFNPSSDDSAFVYSNSTMSDLGIGLSQGIGINSSGQITGNYQHGNIIGNEVTTAFLYSGGSLHDLGTLSSYIGSYSYGYSINSSGQVTGNSLDDSNLNYHAFLYSGGGMHDLGTLPGTDSSTGKSINDFGWVTGYSDISAPPYNGLGNQAFLCNGTSMIPLGTLGGDVSGGLSINNSGQIVGDSDIANGNFHAFLYASGSMKDLNSLATPDSGWILGSASGINDRSQIAGEGTAPNGQQHAFLWTPSGGMQVLPITTAANYGSNIANVSADGSVLVGHEPNSVTPNLDVPIQIVNGGSVQALPLLAGANQGDANGVSSNGSVIGGVVSGPGFERAVRWVGGAAQNLGLLASGTYSAGRGISGDGNVVVGYGDASGSTEQALRWTSAGGMQGLAFLAGGTNKSYASGASGDGSVIVGAAFNSAGQQAVRWVNGGTPQALGNVPGTTSSYGSAVTSLGDVIVGNSLGSSGGIVAAFVWDQARGMRTLQSVLLSEYGVDFTGWTLNNVNSISAAGDAVCGSGIDPSGNTQAWVAQINSRTYRYLSGETYTGFHTSHLGGFGTSVDVLGGTAGGAASTYKTLTITTKAAGAALAPAAFGFASDIATVSGIDGDTFVMELSYNEATATALFGSEAAARLAWYDPATQQWENAVSGDTGGTATFAGDRAYNPATDTLGSFGVDTANNEVWAVVNHNSEFGVTTGVVVPEPSAWASLAVGAAALLGFRRRRVAGGV